MAVFTEQEQIDAFDEEAGELYTEYNRLENLNTRLSAQKTSTVNRLDAQIAANTVLMGTAGTTFTNLLYKYEFLTGETLSDDYRDLLKEVNGWSDAEVDSHIGA